MTRLRRRWAALPAGDRRLLVLAAAGVALKVLLAGSVLGSPVVGDEAAYLDAGRALSNVVRDLASLHAPDQAQVGRDVVGSGWFMPGMGVVTAPVFLVVPAAPVVLVRLWLGLVSTVVFLATVLTVRRSLGRGPAGALLVFPGLVPMYAVFGLAAYGDELAGLLVVLLLCRLVVLLRGVRVGTAPGWRDGAVVGLLAITAVYLRSSVLLVVALVGTSAAMTAWAFAPRERRGRLLGALAAAGVVFAGLLAPWTAVASATLGAPVVTTTSVPTVMANTFGDRDEVCFGECDPGSSIWFSPLRYSRETARATGASEVEVQREMSAYARRDTTPHTYAVAVLHNLGRYVGNPSGFAELLRDPHAAYDVRLLTHVGTVALFFPALLAGLALLGAVVRAGPDEQVHALLLKLAVLALLAQPFVHLCGSRYWTTLAPLLGLAAPLVWEAWAGRVVREAGSRWLARAHGAVAAAGVAVALGLVTLAV